MTMKTRTELERVLATVEKELKADNPMCGEQYQQGWCSALHWVLGYSNW